MNQNLEINLNLPKSTKSITVLEIYNSYAKALLDQNPEYWSKPTRKCKYAFIYHKRKVGKTETVYEVISYARFRLTVETLFLKSRDLICDGHVLNLGGNLGKIAGHLIENNLKTQATKRRIDWPATMKNPVNPVTGRRNAVYKPVQDTYCRIGWEKNMMIKNSNVMEFKPTTSNTGMNDPNHMGFANQFSANLLDNPNIQLLYRYFAIK